MLVLHWYLVSGLEKSSLSTRRCRWGRFVVSGAAGIHWGPLIPVCVRSVRQDASIHSCLLKEIPIRAATIVIAD